jgi:hypothetical protein
VERNQGRQAAVKTKRDDDGCLLENEVRERRRPKYLLSGLTQCGCCGGGYAMMSADLLGCSTAPNKGTCKNRTNIRRDRLEERVLNALRFHLMEPKLFREFCEEFTHEMNRLRADGRAAIDAAKSELGRVERQIKLTVDAIADGMYYPSMKEKMDGLEARKNELQATLATLSEPPPLLHPEMANFYRVQVTELYEALQEETEAKRLRASEALRSLIKAIILTPEDGELKIDVRGDLAGILNVSLKRKNPATEGRGSQVQMVAGTKCLPHGLNDGWDIAPSLAGERF